MIRFPFLQVLLCAVFSLAATTLLAQSVPPPPPPPPPPPGTVSDKHVELDTNDVFIAVENPAMFPGGDAALQEFLRANIKYPQRCQDSSYTATIYMSFIVERDGRLTDIKTIKGFKLCPEFAEECVRVIQLMPRWIPGHFQGRAVRVSCSVPVRFKLI